MVRIFNIPYRLFIFFVMTACLLGVCVWITLFNLPILERLNIEGKTARAEVLWVGEPYIVFGRSNYSRYSWRQDARYGYRTKNGQWIEDEKTYVKQNTPDVGQAFDVVYLPDAPQIHDSGLGNGYAGIGMVYALLPLAGVCAFMVFYYWRRLPPDWKGPRVWPLISNLSGST